MTKKKVRFLNMMEVVDFVTIASTFPEDIQFLSDGCLTDAKSLLGIFSMDISKPIHIVIHGNGAAAQKVCGALEKYIV